MKHNKQMLSIVLLAAMLLWAVPFAGAEPAKEGTWQADLVSLMNPRDVPSATTLRYDLSIADSGTMDYRLYSQDLVSNNGDVLNIQMRFVLNGITLSDTQWEVVRDWLKTLVVGAVQRVGADTQSLANVVAQAWEEQRANVQPGATGMPVWGNEGLLLQQVTATLPYFPELSVGVNGSATQRLQERLIQLGYLDDTADGYYGNNTKAAVEKLEGYVRELEQDMIDARIRESGPALQTLSYEKQPAATEEPADNMQRSSAPSMLPVTPVDGVADPLLQAYLYSGDFKVTRGELKAGDKGEAVKRLQTRLLRMGFSADAVDGAYGGSTSRAVRIFQYYNKLPQTGIADVATQQLLFSGNVVVPDNAMLGPGSKGAEVEKLQTRLSTLGFGALTVDGDYGNSTTLAVQTLQKYLREIEQEALQASNPGADVTGMISTQVNGIADPILLQDFYSTSFPAVPKTLSNGSKGRDVVRLQRRLKMLDYYYGDLDGGYGAGTASAVKDFQKRHGLEQSGIADTITLTKLFSESAKKGLKPYVLKVSIAKQRVYAYAPDENENYTVLVKTMVCSTGTRANPTPTGTFQDGTGPGARWHRFTKFNCWAQYAYYVVGDVMIHSVIYSTKEGRVNSGSVKALGSRASHGCVRLSVDFAMYDTATTEIYTKIIIE